MPFRAFERSDVATKKGEFLLPKELSIAMYLLYMDFSSSRFFTALISSIACCSKDGLPSGSLFTSSKSVYGEQGI